MNIFIIVKHLHFQSVIVFFYSYLISLLLCLPDCILTTFYFFYSFCFSVIIFFLFKVIFFWTTLKIIFSEKFPKTDNFIRQKPLQLSRQRYENYHKQSHFHLENQAKTFVPVKQFRLHFYLRRLVF